MIFSATFVSNISHSKKYWARNQNNHGQIFVRTCKWCRDVLPRLKCLNTADLDPEFFIQCTSNETPLKQDNNPLLVTLLNFKVQILLPVLKLATFQGLYMEVWSLDLETQIYSKCYKQKQWTETRAYIPSVQQKSSGLKFSKSRNGSHMTYSCHHNSSHFTLPIFMHSWCFSVFHSLQSIMPRIY